MTASANATDASTMNSPDVRAGFQPPRVTIIIPSYNRAEYLKQTIASCMAQEYPHCKILVTDDGSTDGSVELVRSLAGQGVGLVTGVHAGAPTNRNRGLAVVDTPFVMWIGDDDVLMPDVVRRRIEVLAEHPDADVIHGDTLICDVNLKPQNVITAEDWSNRPEALVSTLFNRNVLSDGGTLIRMALYARAGWYDAAFPKGQDYHLWSRAALRAKFVYSPGVGYLWRWHGANMGLGGGTNPYADCHRRIVLEMWTRYDKRLLFPHVQWDAIAPEMHDAAAAVSLAQRLVREDAWEDAHRFAQLAVTLGAGAEAAAFAKTLKGKIPA